MKLIMYIVAYALYYAGDLVSKPMLWQWTGEAGCKLYPLYHWLMLKSSGIQDANGLSGPWVNSMTDVKQAREQVRKSLPEGKNDD